MQRLLIVLAILTQVWLAPPKAHSEYRVFQLQFTSAIDGTILSEHPSTLDPEQYVGYYPLPAGQKIGYQQTWMCKGNTAYRRPCANPNLTAASEGTVPPEVNNPQSTNVQVPNSP